MQTLVLKNKYGVAIIRKEFDSDKDARIEMQRNEILEPGYFYEMEDKSKSSLCMIDFLEKILKSVVYNLDYDDMTNEEINEYLTGRIADDARFTCEEIKMLIKFIEMLYPRK